MSDGIENLTMHSDHFSRAGDKDPSPKGQTLRKKGAQSFGSKVTLRGYDGRATEGGVTHAFGAEAKLLFVPRFSVSDAGGHCCHH